MSAPGFRTTEQKDILLKAGERTGIEVRLTVGEVGQTVEVNAATPLLQTESTQATHTRPLLGTNLEAVSRLLTAAGKSLRCSASRPARNDSSKVADAANSRNRARTTGLPLSYCKGGKRCGIGNCGT